MIKRVLLSVAVLLALLFAKQATARDNISGELQLSDAYLDLSKSVYYAYSNEDRTSGGTAFAVTNSIGQTIIVTNSHVCGEDIKVYLGQDGSDKLFESRVLRKDPIHDLCEVVAPPKAKPLKLSAVNPVQFDLIVVIGHPRLEPIMPSPGYVLTMKEVFIHQTGSACGHENEIIKEADGCYVLHHGYASNAMILPGSSGSPVFNTSGEVIGVAFIGGPTGAMFITRDDLERFLKNI
jgi:S1-C subfamily serine protease